MNRVRPHKQILVLILLFLYSFGITSSASIHLIHDLFHLLEKSQHLHDHAHNHHNDHKNHAHLQGHEEYANEVSDRHEQSKPEQINHGHRHNKYIDAMLQSIEKEPQTPESHVLYVLELYYHMNFIFQDPTEDLVPTKNERYIDIKLMSTLYYPSPPTPPPKFS
jgi:hypothetical protein